MKKYKGKKVKKAHADNLKRHKEFLDWIKKDAPQIRNCWNS
jgi:hypothetical protein